MYIAIQILQVLIAPIPGQVTSLVGGVLLGALWEAVYTYPNCQPRNDHQRRAGRRRIEVVTAG